MNNNILINPILVIQKGDFLGSGIPYMPHILAYTAGLLKQNNIPYQIIDAFGQNPFKIINKGQFYWQGIAIKEILSQIKSDNPNIFIYSSSITNLDFNSQLTKNIRTKFPKSRIIILANTQAVTSFDITSVKKQILDNANIIIYNNIENTTLDLLKNNFETKKTQNIIYKSKNKTITNPMSLEIGETKKVIIPTWEDFPLKNYWDLGYSHGPIQKSYLPLLTSYGCPFHCNFCVNPTINKSRWQPKTAQNVFTEIKSLKETLGVSEFHTEDLNPTVDKYRIQNICKLLISHNLKINWKIVAGTKVETIDESTLDIMKKSGCNYISISPESGSKNVLKLMAKPFDYNYANQIIHHCYKIGIETQACFVIGFPGETQSDRKETEKYIKQITKLGISEIAIFIASPIPGSKIFKLLKGYKTFSDLTFSPKWRKDYPKLEKFRKNLYFKFILWKLLFHPSKILWQGMNFLTHNFKTKMEMIPYRILKFKLLLLTNHASKKEN